MATPWRRAPLLLGAGGSALLLLVGGAGWPSLAAAAALLAAALHAARWLSARAAAERAEAAAQAQCEIERMARLCAVSAPLWARQIETVRSEGDGEVAQLTRLFGRIAQRLDSAIGPAGWRAPAGADLLAQLDDNRERLDRLVEALGQLQSSRERIVAEIGSEAARLKENAADIRQIAMQTRIVALNATIEAARAGTAGRPFAVIVSGMRELAARSAEASDQFSRHTDRLHGMVQAAFHEQSPAAGEPGGSIAWGQSLVREVVDSFESAMAELARAIEAMGHERREVRDDVSRVLVALQFQDRVSQILSHVTRNLHELQRELDGGRFESTDAGDWLQRLAQPYSTPEELRNLQPDAAPGVPAGARAADEITYF
ncbi:methyl-accepting chemotaxis protein [Ramlibacter tataouinensis]|uniref:methyl-accepting chemotaxis protein n=1 Tax=Ramlibacter tataouinensis TaxID=94132 RepID=UPI0022F3BE32|nr:methyl-accepting chemotaxis protein [Ramlibacter tataouinensis]WBY00226.1 methyl-accepting chemotaxis protein [Ramlibacter tataouinensis]